MAEYNGYEDPETERRYRLRALQGELDSGLGGLGSDGVSGNTRVDPTPRPTNDSSAPQQPSSGGSSRDQALQQVQQAYSSAPAAATGMNGEGSTDGVDRFRSTPVPWNDPRVQAQLSKGVSRDYIQRWITNNGPEDLDRMDAAIWGGSDRQLLPGSGSAYTASQGGVASRGGSVNSFTQGARDILMQQLGTLSKPVSAADPGIADVLTGQRIASQRGAERQRAMEAERLALEGVADSGAADTSRLGIEQQRGEADAQFTGQVLNQELQNRRAALQNLLGMALQSGDAEAARAIQMQLAEMGQANFQDDLAFRYTGLNQNSNLQALMALLGAV